MADSVVTLPRRDSAAEPTTSSTEWTGVDAWGRDPRLIGALAPLGRMRWDLVVGGDHHLASQRRGALLVNNGRRWSMSTLITVLALGDSLDRPVRFAGRPDIAPVGPLLRRLGGLIDSPAEVAGALRHGELVVISTAPTGHHRHAGAVDPTLVAVARHEGVVVHPVATLATPLARRIRVEVGAAIRPRYKRRGPLGDLELAESARRGVQTMLDSLGGPRTGLAPIDWITRS